MCSSDLHWPLYRFRPAGAGRAREEFVLDSLPPSIPLKTYAYNEIRYRMLADSKPDEAERLLALAQEDVHHRWQVYRDLARRWPAAPGRSPDPAGKSAPVPGH